MSTLTTSRIAQLLTSYYPADEQLCQQLSLYLDLLLKWNVRTNLTAIRDPEQIVTRHFGESLFLAAHIPASAKTLLDLGSGAGFPGLPVQLALPKLQVTLAESQNKKSAFLQEAVRVLSLQTRVWAARAETLPESSRFDCVALRAVDRPDEALQEAETRAKAGGLILHLAGIESAGAGSIPVPSGSTVLKVFHVEHSGEAGTDETGIDG